MASASAVSCRVQSTPTLLATLQPGVKGGSWRRQMWRRRSSICFGIRRVVYRVGLSYARRPRESLVRDRSSSACRRLGHYNLLARIGVREQGEVLLVRDTVKG